MIRGVVGSSAPKGAHLAHRGAGGATWRGCSTPQAFGSNRPRTSCKVLRVARTAAPERRACLDALGDWRSGSALPSHGRGHWFDPSIAHCEILGSRVADVAQLVEHHLAKVRVAGSSPVVRSRPRGSSIPGVHPSGCARAIGAAVARFPDTEEVTGSIPVSPTGRRRPQILDLGPSVIVRHGASTCGRREAPGAGRLRSLGGRAIVVPQARPEVVPRPQSTDRSGRTGAPRRRSTPSHAGPRAKHPVARSRRSIVDLRRGRDSAATEHG